jgi:WD40 repeat protein
MVPSSPSPSRRLMRRPGRTLAVTGLVLALAAAVCARPFLAGGPAAPVRTEAAPPPPTDPYGDPLPNGALFRVGTLRLRHTGRVEQLAFGANGRRLASTAAGALHLWDLPAGREVHASPKDGYYFALSPDGTTLAATVQGRLCLLDAATGSPRHVLREKCLFQWLCMFSADGRTLQVTEYNPFRQDADDRHCVTGWDVAGGHKLYQWDLPEGQMPRAFLPDGRSLVTESESRHIFRLWDTATGKEFREWPGVCKRFAFGFAHAAAAPAAAGRPR